jgi:hypothetical protein
VCVSEASILITIHINKLTLRNEYKVMTFVSNKFSLEKTEGEILLPNRLFLLYCTKETGPFLRRTDRYPGKRYLTVTD